MIKPFIKRFPSGAFGVCLFNVVAFLCLERLGLALTVALAYAVDIAYVVLVARHPARASGGRARDAGGRRLSPPRALAVA